MMISCKIAGMKYKSVDGSNSKTNKIALSLEDLAELCVFVLWFQSKPFNFSMNFKIDCLPVSVSANLEIILYALFALMDSLPKKQ